MKQVSLTRAQLDFPAGLYLGLELQTKKTPTWGLLTETHMKLGISSLDPPRPHPIFRTGVHRGIHISTSQFENVYLPRKSR